MCIDVYQHVCMHIKHVLNHLKLTLQNINSHQVGAIK